MSNLTDKEIRDAIVDTIRPVTSDSILLNRWILGLGIGESVPYIKLPAQEKVHAYMVSRKSMGREKVKINSGQYLDTQVYKLWGFYSFRAGNNDSNSEDEFGLEIDQIQQTLADKPRLIFDNGDYNFVEHHDWQIPEINIYDFGKYKVHVAQGELEVVLRVQPQQS